ncbi:electron transport complex subunit RsxG [Alteromonas oceanisediminis]|uniref:electron transport complex subunit RsxG n=1 Tax=Alteromonas oceanisediminis TaxID=2836180 RepID=UPI001BD9BE20|nr:electron transport complex subunit RsxG [Alteromonas oceanisediminis]MBT0584808.1 electron transport complex subunit RsxG [Alteromonas oceanisediminis]
MLRSASKNGLILAGFAVVTTALIGLTYVFTKDTIAQQKQTLLRNTIEQVMPASYYSNDIAQSCLLVFDPVLHASEPQRIYQARNEGQATGYVVETTAPNGYSGNIHLLMGVLLDGTVTGVRVLDHKETPGLGDKIDLRISDWILSFSGKRVTDETADAWEVKKDGGQFDQFTGATITPRAVVNQVERTVLTVRSNVQQWLLSGQTCDSKPDENMQEPQA